LNRFHLDTDFLIYALSVRGPEWKRLDAIVVSEAILEISAVAWCEFCRGPRTPEQIAIARSLFGDAGIIPFDEGLAEWAADEFRRLGNPRKRVGDIAIGVTASASNATLLTRNHEDFSDVTGLTVEVVRG
jgi:predicted nucleic acid-binding protein